MRIRTERDAAQGLEAANRRYLSKAHHRPERSDPYWRILGRFFTALVIVVIAVRVAKWAGFL